MRGLSLIADPEDTVSRALYDMGCRFVWLPVGVALLIGHLMVPLRIPKDVVKPVLKSRRYAVMAS